MGKFKENRRGREMGKRIDIGGKWDREKGRETGKILGRWKNIREMERLGRWKDIREMERSWGDGKILGRWKEGF